jgi:hypothetical protein
VLAFANAFWRMRIGDISHMTNVEKTNIIFLLRYETGDISEWRPVHGLFSPIMTGDKQIAPSCSCPT